MTDRQQIRADGFAFPAAGSVTDLTGLGHAVSRVPTRPHLTQQVASGWPDPLRDMLSSRDPGPVPPNASNTLRMVHLLVSRGVRTSPDDVAAVPHRALALGRVADALHAATPWMW